MSERRYAGFWRRAAAHAIDALVFLPVAVLLLIAVYGVDYFLAPPADPLATYRGPADFIINQVLPFIVIILLWARYGATPGKYLMHCRIVDAATGKPPRVGQAILRYFAYIVSLLPLGLGFWWIAWDERKQSFHDKIAKTVVVHVEEDESGKSVEQLMGEAR